MRRTPIRTLFFLAAAALLVHAFLHSATRAEDPAKAVSTGDEPILLWPGVAPGEKGDIGEEKHTPGKDPRGGALIMVTNVTKPTITLFRPAADKNTGAAVIVCPGGGYGGLAYDFEGSEACQWLNTLGVTGVLLKYRVPGRGGERFTAPLQDAQRAIGLVRSRAQEWKIDPKRVGILGFSAGGHLSAAASTNFGTRTYPAIDAADKVSCRPDFTMLIYPAYLLANDDTRAMKLATEIKVTGETPPAFIVMTGNDPIHVECAYAYGLALKNAKVAAELHIYALGGHGYGVRPSPYPVSTWPERAAEWLKSQGWLAAK